MKRVWEFPLFKWAYGYILDGSKTVATRVSDETKPEKDYRYVESGDIAVFSVITEDGVILSEYKPLSYEIKSLQNYENPEELLMAEGLHNVLPHKDTIEDGVNLIMGFPDYPRRIPLYGINAMPLGPRLWPESFSGGSFVASLSPAGVYDTSLSVDKIVESLSQVEGVKFTYIDRNDSGNIQFRCDKTIPRIYRKADLDPKQVKIDRKTIQLPVLK